MIYMADDDNEDCIHGIWPFESCTICNPPESKLIVFKDDPKKLIFKFGRE